MTAHSVLNVRAAPEWGNSELYNYYERNGLGYGTVHWEHFVDIDTMPHAMYFTGDSDTVTKINQVPYQMIEYNNNGMFTVKLMNDTLIEIFIYYGATPSILPLCTYNKFPILHKYPKKAILPYIQEEV